MRKSSFSTLPPLCVVLFLSFLLSCKDDSDLAAPQEIPDHSFVEEFDTFQTAYNKGWRFINRSEAIGPTDWEAGSISGILTAYSSRGTNAGFISSDYQATSAATAVISNWAVSPAVTMKNGDKIIFYTRTYLANNTSRAYNNYYYSNDSTDWANRLQVRINPHNDGLHVGHAFDPGHFDMVLLDINPDYLENVGMGNITPAASPPNPPGTVPPLVYNPNAYPERWTRFEAVVFGLNNPVKGRFAFRYFVEDAGSNGRGNEVGIDSVAFVSKK